jgi:hypothetical protein
MEMNDKRMHNDEFQPIISDPSKEGVQKLLENACNEDREYMRGFADGAEAAIAGILELLRLAIPQDDIHRLTEMYEQDIVRWRRKPTKEESPRFWPGAYLPRLDDPEH